MICRRAPAQVRLTRKDVELAIQRYLNYTGYNDTNLDIEVTGSTYHRNSEFVVTVDVRPKEEKKA